MSSLRMPLGAHALLLGVLVVAPSVLAGDGTLVSGVQKISNLEGGFSGGLLGTEQWGIAAKAIGDLDGDGVTEVAVGQPRQEDVGLNGFGAVWILFMNADGTVRGDVEITPGLNGFTATLEDGDSFGIGIAALGDLDGDGVEDIAVGAKDDGPGFGHGGLYVLRLNADGTVKAWSHVTNGTAGLSLDNSDGFGIDLDGLGDLDGDGTPDLAVGAWFDGDGAFGAGAVYVLFLTPSGGVKSWSKISNTSGGLDTFIPAFVRFGRSVGNLGDLDGDGVVDLAVGTLFGTEADGTDSGAIYIVFLNPNGTVKSTRKISEGLGGFDGVLTDGDAFGSAVAALGDLDGNGVTELAVGAAQDSQAANDAGAVWVLSLAPDGSVHDELKLTGGWNGFTPALAPSVAFGISLANLGDLDGDGHADLMIGSSLDGDGAFEAGAVYVCFLQPARFVQLGFALPGAGGEMPLELTGALAGGDAVGLSVTNAPASAPGFLLLSPFAGFVPALGGTLVPDPLQLSTLAPVATDSSGALALASTWPAGLPPGFTLFAQVWVQDPTATAGWAATQGWKAIQP